jgi:hypothetical protein
MLVEVNSAVTPVSCTEREYCAGCQAGCEWLLLLVNIVKKVMRQDVRCPLSDSHCHDVMPITFSNSPNQPPQVRLGVGITLCLLLQEASSQAFGITN